MRALLRCDSSRGCEKELNCGFCIFKVDSIEQLGRLHVACENKRGIRDYSKLIDIGKWKKEASIN